MKPTPSFIFHNTSNIPGIWMVLIKVTYQNQSLYHVTKTGHIKARRLTAPATDIPQRLSEDYIHPNPLRKHLTTQEWPINECSFQCWTYGPIETSDDYSNLSWEDLNRVVAVATYQAEFRLAAEGLNVLMIHKSITLDHEDLESSTYQLSTNFLAQISTAYLTP
jgi:hypothetical protein